MATYKSFVAREEPFEIIKHYSKKNLPSILGSEKFIEMVKSSFTKKKKEKEIPESKSLCPEAIEIKKAVCRYCKIEEAELLKSRRGVENEARDIAIYILRVIRGEPLEKIGQEFNLNNYSSVSSAVNRVRKKLESRKFKIHYGKIKDMI